MTDVLHGVESIMWVAAAPELMGTSGWHARSDFLATQLYMKRITLHSPLEIVVAVGVVAGISTTIGQRVLRVWDRYQESRVGLHRSNALIAAYNALEADLKRDPRIRADSEPVVARIEIAAKTLNEIESLKPGGQVA